MTIPTTLHIKAGGVSTLMKFSSFVLSFLVLPILGCEYGLKSSSNTPSLLNLTTPTMSSLSAKTSAFDSHRPIVFFHTQKCGGWTIHHYFSKKFKSLDGNSCINDWRCDMKFRSNTSKWHQCLAFKQYYQSK